MFKKCRSRHDLSHTASSLPWKRTDDTDAGEVKLKNAFAQMGEETQTHRGKDRDNTHTSKRERQDGWLNLLEDQVQNIWNEEPTARGERGPRTASGSAQRSLSEKRGQEGESWKRERKRQGEVGTQPACSCACGTTINMGIGTINTRLNRFIEAEIDPPEGW